MRFDDLVLKIESLVNNYSDNVNNSSCKIGKYSSTIEGLYKLSIEIIKGDEK